MLPTTLRSSIFFLLAALVTTPLYSQKWRAVRRATHRQATFTSKVSFDTKSYRSIGVSVNALNYYGDLSPLPQRVSTDISFTRPGIAISYNKKQGPRFGWQTQFLFGYLRGSDAQSAEKDPSGIYRKMRNASFRNPINELSLAITMDLFKNDGFYFNRPLWSPYVFAGAAIFHHNPQAKAPATDLSGQPLPQGGQWVNLQPLGTEGQLATLQPEDKNYGIKPYKLFQPTVFGGYGVKFQAGAMIDLAMEISFRYTFTDYLDDVSRNYVDLGVFSSELARSMSYRTNELQLTHGQHTYTARNGVNYNVQAGYGSEHRDNMRGNPKDRDLYMVTSVKASMILGRNVRKAKSR